jgi:hypothetical protein
MMDTLRNYTFLPWLRQGLAADISTVDRLGNPGASAERAELSVKLQVNGEDVEKQVHLLGPGDVLGINPRVVVKTEPRHWVTDFEPNYLAYIEFIEEDYLWRFAPAAAAGELTTSQLRPWLLLVVLAEDEFKEKKTGGPLAAFEIDTTVVSLHEVFPDTGQSWAWAHVHVSKNIIGDKLQTATKEDVERVGQNLEELLRTNADYASSRLLCPRKLQANRAYHAFVIPSFETGRLAGLGLDIPDGTDGQQASWAEDARLYPIYYRWFFRTGARGDFEFLVDLLESRKVDKKVGIRDMDMQQPNYEVEGMTSPLDVMGLEGALKSPETESVPEAWPPEDTDFEHPPIGSAGFFLNQLEEKVNLQFNLQQKDSADDPDTDPIISPPLYGKWYAKEEALDVQEGTGWVHELNRDPRYRTPAGFGTQVIQNGQEQFMQQAWSQLGDLIQANQKIRQLQLAWMTTYRMYVKHVLPQSPDRLLAFTQAVQTRILGSPTTIAQQVRDSRLPQAALNAAFRKITRRRGAIMRKVEPDTATPTPPVLSQLNAGELSAAPAAPEPTGQMSLHRIAESLVPDGLPDGLRRLIRDRTIRWLLIALLAIALALLVAGVGAVIAGGLAVVAGGLLLVSERLRRRIETAEAFQEEQFTPETVDAIPARPNFVLTEFEVDMPATGNQVNADSVEAANFKTALKDAYNVFQSPPPAPPEREPLGIAEAVTSLQQALNPAITMPKRAAFSLKIPATIRDTYLRPNPTLVHVMAHPVFAEPMYRRLRDISAELLVPNLNLIPNNTISLLETNPKFIESYMVGLNHEMGRELLSRSFPTDQRGSYFRQFWDVSAAVNRDSDAAPEEVEEALLDITKLHTWSRDTELGTHENRLPSDTEPDAARLVLVIRGDLLKRYPTTRIYAQKAKWNQDDRIRELDDSNPAQNIKEPIFQAEVEPDVQFLGFNLTASVAKGNTDPQADPETVDHGWFFCLLQPPGEPRFGLDNRSDESPEIPNNWNDLAWEHLGNFDSLGVIDFDEGINATITASPDDQFVWGRNAADMAYILYQVPIMVAFHAADMLE